MPDAYRITAAEGHSAHVTATIAEEARARLPESPQPQRRGRRRTELKPPLALGLTACTSLDRFASSCPCRSRVAVLSRKLRVPAIPSVAGLLDAVLAGVQLRTSLLAARQLAVHLRKSQCEGGVGAQQHGAEAIV